MDADIKVVLWTIASLNRFPVNIIYNKENSIENRQEKRGFQK